MKKKPEEIWKTLISCDNICIEPEIDINFSKFSELIPTKHLTTLVLAKNNQKIYTGNSKGQDQSFIVGFVGVNALGDLVLVSNSILDCSPTYKFWIIVSKSQKIPLEYNDVHKMLEDVSKNLGKLFSEKN